MAARVTRSEIITMAQLDASLGTVADVAKSIATVIVDERVAVLGVHSENALRNIELFLACHFATLSAEKGPKASETIGEATERFHDIYGAGLNATRFGQQAILLDTTGTLGSMSAQAIKPQLTALFTVVGDPPATILEEEDEL